MQIDRCIFDVTENEAKWKRISMEIWWIQTQIDNNATLRLFCYIFVSNPGIKEIVSYMKHYFKRDGLILSEYIVVSAVKISPVQTFVLRERF